MSSSQHFQNLPPGYRERATLYWLKEKKDPSYGYFDDYDKLSWLSYQKTQEGPEFWSQVYSWAVYPKRCKLPILPPLIEEPPIQRRVFVTDNCFSQFYSDYNIQWT